MLSRGQIKFLSDPATASEPLITPIDEKMMPPAAYDLRLGHIIVGEEYLRWDGPMDADGPERLPEIHVLQSGEVATLATYEVLHLRSDVNGVIVPRDKKAKQGLLILNAGHIDPSYHGIVTGQVINMTDRPLPLTLGDKYFSVIFQWVSEPKPTDDETNGLKDVAPEVYVTDLRVKAVERPLSLINQGVLRQTYIAKDDLTIEIVKRMVPFVVTLAGFVAVILGILQVAGVFGG